MTHCTISMKEGDSIRTIYCHLDGYPDGVGLILVKHYIDRYKIEALLDCGDLRSLGEHLTPVPLPPKHRTIFQKLFGLNKPKVLGLAFNPDTGKYEENDKPHSEFNLWLGVTVPLEAKDSEFFEEAKIYKADEPQDLEQFNYMFENNVWLFKNFEDDSWVNLIDFLVSEVKKRYPVKFHHLINI